MFPSSVCLLLCNCILLVHSYLFSFIVFRPSLTIAETYLGHPTHPSSHLLPLLFPSPPSFPHPFCLLLAFLTPIHHYTYPTTLFSPLLQALLLPPQLPTAHFSFTSTMPQFPTMPSAPLPARTTLPLLPPFYPISFHAITTLPQVTCCIRIPYYYCGKSWLLSHPITVVPSHHHHNSTHLHSFGRRVPHIPSLVLGLKNRKTCRQRRLDRMEDIVVVETRDILDIFSTTCSPLPPCCVVGKMCVFMGCVGQFCVVVAWMTWFCAPSVSMFLTT